MAILLDQVTADTNSAALAIKGGSGIMHVRADDFGGGTVEIQVASASDAVGPRWVTLPNGSFTADASVKLDYLPSGTLLRVVFTGAGAAINVFAEFLQ